jgi:hypothetical protein
MSDHVLPTDLLSALERLLRKASPAPWASGGYTDKAPARYTLFNGYESIGELYSDADRAAIVALRNSAPDLIYEIRKLRKDIWRANEHGKDAVNALLVENDALRARVAELESDAERWRAVVRLAGGYGLELCRVISPDDVIYWVVDNHSTISAEGHTPEDALDAALEEEKRRG